MVKKQAISKSTFRTQKPHSKRNNGGLFTGELL